MNIINRKAALSLYNSPPPAMKMKTKISSCIYLYLADGITHRTHLWMHCVGLGLINTYNVVGNQASRSCVIIGEHFGLQNWTKSLPPRCVSVCVCAWEGEKKNKTHQPTALHCMLSYWNIWTDSSFVTTVRTRLTWFDIEGQTNAKALSYSLNASPSLSRQGCLCVFECVWMHLSQWPREMHCHAKV